MPNRENVIYTFECHMSNGYKDCNKCNYPCREDDTITMPRELVKDALALLKMQEPVEPTKSNYTYFCGNPRCKKIITEMVPSGAPMYKAKYCSECGMAVKWR